MNRDVCDLSSWNEYFNGVYQYVYDGYITFEILLNHTYQKNGGDKRLCGKACLYICQIEFHNNQTWDLHRMKLEENITVAACLEVTKGIIEYYEDRK